MSNMSPASRATAPHYTWGDACDGWHLVRTPELAILEERMPANTAERRHSHTHARQFFYVLAGTLTLELNGELHILNRNQGLEIPPGLPHLASNKSPEDTRFLVTSQPSSHGDRTDA